MSFSFTVKHEDELFEITNKLAPTLKNQQIIFIEGSVGVGKTTFIRHLLETLAKNNQSKFFFQAEDGIRDLVRSRGLGDVYKRQLMVEVHSQVKTQLKLIDLQHMHHAI